MPKKIAVVLFNLGGPDSQEAVRPFLFNLFYDKAIISLPNPLRYFLAKIISYKRDPVAKEIYNNIGGKSPILEETSKQAKALEERLNGQGEDSYKLFISMRYWHPFSYEVIDEIKKYNPDELILLPLYPQYSTTTTGSSFGDWEKKAKKYGLDVVTKKVFNYPTEISFVNAHTGLLRKKYDEVKEEGKPRVLFSAHGLPKRIVDKGDPYQKQVEETVRKVCGNADIKDLDWAVCYQSRVGPLQWIGPSIDDEIKRAGEDKVPVIVVPISFVSEHSETLVELDIEYKKIAEETGVPAYYRVPSLSGDEKFIESLANICLKAEDFSQVC